MPAERTYVPAMPPPASPVTGEELLHAPIADKRVELVRGGWSCGNLRAGGTAGLR